MKKSERDGFYFRLLRRTYIEHSSPGVIDMVDSRNEKRKSFVFSPVSS